MSIKYKYYIGIDVGVMTGVCLWSKVDKTILKIDSMLILDAIDKVKYWYQVYGSDLFIRVEDARQVKFKTDPIKAQGAGSVKRDSQIWDDCLKKLGVAYEMVRPNNRITKLNAETFSKISKYTGRTNSHERDAAMLVIGF